MTTIGIIGSGNIGSNVARAAIAAGYDVLISNARGPESLTGLVGELGSRAEAVDVGQAAAESDMVVVAIPLRAIGTLPVGALAGAVVIDANNYYPERDGRIESLDQNLTTTSELLQDVLPSSRVVKAFNNIWAKHIPADGLPAGHADRRALPVAGDDPDAKAQVIGLLDALGFDAVDAGPLSESWRFERDTPTYGVRTTAAELAAALPLAPRVNQL